MKLELNPETNKSVVSATTADAVAAVSEETVKTVSNSTPGGLNHDMWDKRNLMNSLERVWDSDDTAVISEKAKQGFGIVGDPRIVGDISGESE